MGHIRTLPENSGKETEQVKFIKPWGRYFRGNMGVILKEDAPAMETLGFIERGTFQDRMMTKAEPRRRPATKKGPIKRKRRTRKKTKSQKVSQTG